MAVGITPAFIVEVDGEDISARIQDRLISLSVTDNEGDEADTFRLDIWTSSGRVRAPRRGAKVKIAMGYLETGLSHMGVFTVDQVTKSGWPQKMLITGKSADMRETLKQHRTGTFENKTLGGIVDEVASRNGLGAKVSSGLSSFQYPYLAHTEESDLNLLTRLARKHGAIFKVAEGRVIFAERGKSVSGLDIATVVMTPERMLSYTGGPNDRPRYSNVNASYIDKDTGKREPVELQIDNYDHFGSAAKDPVEFTMRHPYPSEDEARAAAKSKGEELGREEANLTFEAKGDAQIMAGGIVELYGVDPDLDGPWHVETVEHNMNPDYRTTVTANLDKDKASKGGKGSSSGGSDGSGNTLDDLVVNYPD